MKRKEWLRFTPSILWGMTVAILMLLPQDSFSESKFLSYDKLAHIGVFGLLSFLFLIGTQKNKYFLGSKMRKWVKPLIICILYSTILELLQNFSPGRAVDFYDFIANVVGAISGVILFYIFKKNNLVISKLIL
ncbi:VanZ family protein [Roseivirga sp.]|uniref:VanZ family protein n=1 Tax=Roseivirga sp. TaxID=1964215 RepID=UPI003B8E22EF